MSTRICPFHKIEVVKEECRMCVKEDGLIATLVRLKAERDELLAAVKALLPEGWDDGVMDHMPGVKLARLAIAKAEKE